MSNDGNKSILAGMRKCLRFVKLDVEEESDCLIVIDDQSGTFVTERVLENINGEVFSTFYKKGKELKYSIITDETRPNEKSHQYKFYDEGELTSTVTFTTDETGHIVRTEIARMGDEDFNSKKLVVSEISLSGRESLFETTISFDHFVSSETQPDFKRYFSLSQSGLIDKTAILSESSRQKVQYGSISISCREFPDDISCRLDVHPVEGEYKEEPLNRSCTYQAITDLISHPRVNDLVTDLMSGLDEDICDLSFLDGIGNFAELGKVNYNPNSRINGIVDAVTVSDCNRLEPPRTPGAPSMDKIFEGQGSQD